MGDLGRLAYLAPAGERDEAFLYDVFCTTWQDEVNALPNPKLANHVLRIQHTAQDRRFHARYPGHERYLIMHEGQRAGRLYLHRTPTTIHAMDMTLMPEFRSQGIGSRIITDLLEVVARDGQSVTLQVPRRNVRAAALYNTLGFELVATDDLDCYFAWSPSRDAAEQPAGDNGAQLAGA
ncbi:MAG: GNAT family N-acetyltransferase [Nocardioidaceae bacterium]